MYENEKLPVGGVHSKGLNVKFHDMGRWLPPLIVYGMRR